MDIRPESARQPPARISTTLYASSLAVAIAAASASLIGLAYQTTSYPTEELRQSFVPNDLVTLIMGLPVLLGSVWYAYRDRLLVFVMSGYTIVGLIASVDAHRVRRRLTGHIPDRMVACVLLVLGVVFALRTVGILVGAVLDKRPVFATERGLLVADLVITPAWIIGGLLLWQRRAFGYLAGAGLLFQASMLFVGLIAFLLVQPLFTAAPLKLVDILVTAIMGLVCFVPFALLIRGILAGQNAEQNPISRM